MSEMIGGLHYDLPPERFCGVVSILHMSGCVMMENKEAWAQQTLWDGAGNLQSGEIQSVFSCTHVAHKAKYS